MDESEHRSPVSPRAEATEGERFEPASDGPDLAYEHAHRYALAARLVEGLRVLDLACGSGYGRAWLEAASGRPVVSLDRERGVFSGGGLEVVASADALPFAEGSFEAVVFFEAIEHIEDPEAALDEVRRVLAPPGLLLVSTPDREIYTERAGHCNEHHLRELSRAELEEMLATRFPHVSLRGQSVVAGSWVGAARAGDSAAGPRSVEVIPDPLAGTGGPRAAAPTSSGPDAPLPEPVYLLAACATGRAGARRIGERLPADSWLHDPEQWLVGQYTRLIENVERQRGELGAAAFRADRQAGELRSARQSIELLEKERDAAREVVDRQRSELDAARARADRQAVELRTAQERANAQGDELSRAGEAVEALQRELAEAGAEHADLSAQLEQASEAITAQEAELRAAGEVADSQRAELEAAQRGSADQQARLRTARETIDEQHAQLEVAREVSEDHRQQLAAARSGAEDQRAQLQVSAAAIEEQRQQLERARHGSDDQQRQLAVARDAIEAKDRELAIAREGMTQREGELEAAAAASRSLEARLEAEARLLEAARVAQQELAEQLDRVDAHRSGLEAELRRPLLRIVRRLLRAWDEGRRRS